MGPPTKLYTEKEILRILEWKNGTLFFKDSDVVAFGSVKCVLRAPKASQENVSLRFIPYLPLRPYDKSQPSQIFQNTAG